MEDNELRLQQLSLLPPIPSAAVISGSILPTLMARRGSITATLNDGPDLPSPRLALFASPLLPPQPTAHTQQQSDKRRRRPRASVVQTKQLRTPRSLKLQTYAQSSPFHLTSPVHHLSLLSPRHRLPHSPSSAQSRTEPQSPAFLQPLTHMSLLGLTLSPPTLNWTVAAGVLSEAEARSSDMLCRSVSVDVERVIAVDKLIGVDMRNELREVEGEERRVRERRWREEETVRRDREDEQRAQQLSHIAAEIHRDKARVDAARSALLERRYLEWRYRDERVEAEEMADDQRLARHDAYHAAQLRISLNKQEESAAWKNEWRAIQLLQQQRMTEERAAALARQQAEQQRIDAAYTATRLKAKQGRLQLNIVRAKAIAQPFLPANTVAYFVVQLVTDPPTQSLEYPAPVTELRYTPFVACEAVEGSDEVEDVEVGWSSEWVLKSVGRTTLVIGWQCCDREQKERFDKWIRKKEKQRRKETAAAAAADEQQQTQQTSTMPSKPALPKHKASTKKPTNSRKNSRPRKPSATTAAGSATEEHLSAIKRVKKWKELRSHSHRHKVITRVLELGRVEFRLRDVRERDEGEWKGVVDVSGVGWQAKAAADERKRRRKRAGRRRSTTVDGSEGEGGDIDSPTAMSPTLLSARSTTDASILSADSTQPTDADTSVAGATSKVERDKQRLSAAHLTMNPSSLYPSRIREKRSELQLLLMTEKERQQWQEDEERRERIRRDKDDRERRKWSRKVGELWLELKLLPLDADGKPVVREGEKRVEEREEREEEGEDVDGEEKEGAEDEEEAEGDDDEVDEDEDEEEEETAIKRKPKGKQAKSRTQTAKRSRPPETEYLPQQQLRSKAFPVMD